jgi:tryptophanyl-tRNA synthetase
MTDDRDTVIRKFKRAVTDCDGCVRCGEGKEGITNLIEIYAACTGQSIEDIERAFEGRGYGEFKLAVGEAVADTLAPIQEHYATLLADKAQLEALMKMGAERATAVSRRTLEKLKKKIGFLVM